MLFLAFSMHDYLMMSVTYYIPLFQERKILGGAFLINFIRCGGLIFFKPQVDCFLNERLSVEMWKHVSFLIICFFLPSQLYVIYYGKVKSLTKFAYLPFYYLFRFITLIEWHYTMLSIN